MDKIVIQCRRPVSFKPVRMFDDRLDLFGTVERVLDVLVVCRVDRTLCETTAESFESLIVELRWAIAQLKANGGRHGDAP